MNVLQEFCTDCFGNRLRIGDYVMFTIEGKSKSQFRQGLVESIGNKFLIIFELDGKGNIVYKDEEQTTPVRHRRTVLGLMRVFTEEDHLNGEANQNEEESKLH